MRSSLLVGLLLVPALAGAGTECTPLAKSERIVAIRVTPPEGGLMAGISLRLDYPHAKVSLPGEGDKVAPGTLAQTPTGAIAAANDGDGSVRLLLAKAGEIPAGEVMRVRFERCEGAPDVEAADFTCTVLEVSDPTSNLVAGVTCAATLP